MTKMVTTARWRRTNWLLLPCASISLRRSPWKTAPSQQRPEQRWFVHTTIHARRLISIKQNKTKIASCCCRGFVSTAHYNQHRTHNQPPTSCGTLLLVIASIFLHALISLSNKLSLSIDSFSQQRKSHKMMQSNAFSLSVNSQRQRGLRWSLQLKSLLFSGNIYTD